MSSPHQGHGSASLAVVPARHEFRGSHVMSSLATVSVRLEPSPAPGLGDAGGAGEGVQWQVKPGVMRPAAITRLDLVSDSSIAVPFR